MSDSIYQLAQKAKYKSLEAKAELEKMFSTSINTGLTGFNGESIVYNISSEMKESLGFIQNNINKITKSDYKEVIIFDSYYSATIEGAKTTIEEVRQAYRSKNKTKSQKMVLNSIAANKYAIDNGITQDNIRAIWEIIVQDVCENSNLKGSMHRSGMVYVTNEMGDIIHQPCSTENIEKYMSALFKRKYTNVLIDACITHFYFVYIHPFCDGNGRIARTWLYSDLIRKYNSNFKYVSISSEIFNNINSYYKTLKESEFIYGNKINITTFIEYILNCICEAINKGITNNIKLSETEKFILNKINRDGITVRKLSTSKYSESSIRVSLRRLEENGIIYKIKEGRHNRYFKSTT